MADRLIYCAAFIYIFSVYMNSICTSKSAYNSKYVYMCNITIKILYKKTICSWNSFMEPYSKTEA